MKISFVFFFSSCGCATVGYRPFCKM